MGNSMKEAWLLSLEEAIQSSRMHVFGAEDAKSSDIAPLVTTLINSCGAEKIAFLLIKPNVPNNRQQPPTAILYHPTTGILIFSTRQYTASELERGDNAALMARGRGGAQEVNIMDQIDDLRIDVDATVQKQLRQTGKRTSVPVQSLLVLPNITFADWDAANLYDEVDDLFILLADDIELAGTLTDRLNALPGSSNELTPLDKKQWNAVRRAFGDSIVINDIERPARDRPCSESTLGKYLDEVNALDKHLSDEQQDLSTTDIVGTPRLIRGVAGSGKSIVLANLVARYLSRQRDLFDADDRADRVAVLCFNRSLVSMLRRKIEAAYSGRTGGQSLPDSVTVSHFNGLFYDLGQSGVLDYVPITKNETQNRVARYLEQLQMLKETHPDKLESVRFDAIFIDEGQDLSDGEYKLLLELVKPHPETGERTFCIFYDDAQNLYANPRPNWKSVGIDLSRGRSRVMKRCFRNTLPVVELAFNVLLGTQSPHGSAATKTFADVATLRQSDLIEESQDYVQVKFTRRKGPPPHARAFASRSEEKEYVAKEILRLIKKECVRPEDILVLFARTCSEGKSD